MTHVIDELELYTLGALPKAEAERVGRHLAACPTCREAAAEMAEVVAQLPDAIPLREPRAELKVRILEAARADTTRRSWISLPWPLPRLGFAVITVAAVALIAVDMSQARALSELRSEQREYDTLTADLAHGGRSWYMAGVDEWRGAGGNLLQLSASGTAVVLFHDLRALPAEQMYAVWLIGEDGHWVRAANARPDGHTVQMVTLDIDARGYDWCAVTVETSPAGKHAGPVVMQSVKGALLAQ